ncbi:unnamed protein product [Schistocephalus solidus]|uniref:C2 domain-containing protein n=1 Tax=Schistocephalus solidus TaxID=70667 RepID=A0A183STT1_SCHSO|nr:unnamed protein product [Schistocephalus solidus]
MTLLNHSSTDFFTNLPATMSTDFSSLPSGHPDSFISRLSESWKIDNRPAVIFLFTFLILFVILLVLALIAVVGWVYVRRRKRRRGGSIHESLNSENPPIYKEEMVRCLACLSQLQYSMEYRLKEKKLLVGIIGCTNLQAPPGVRAPSPFVRILLRTVTVQNPINQHEAEISKVVSTAVLLGTRNPQFREMFAFSLLPTEIRSTVVHLRVYHFDKTNPDLILGGLEVDLKKTPVENYFGKYYEVQEPLLETVYGLEEYGQLCVVIIYEKKAKKLKVHILDAKDLSQPAKTSNIYPKVQVSVTLLVGGRTSLKERTAARKNVADPYFGSLLTFPLKCKNAALFTLKLKLQYFDERGLIKTHGIVIIGPNSPQAPGRRHWRDVDARPEEAIGMWHAFTCYKPT